MDYDVTFWRERNENKFLKKSHKNFQICLTPWKNN